MYVGSMYDVDVCGRCGVIEEFSHLWGGSADRIDVIKGADVTLYPDNRQGGPW